MQTYRTIKIRLSTYQALKVQAAQRGETMMDLIDRLSRQDRTVATYRERLLIAHIQALISAHRYPAMYNVAGVIEDAEQAWQKANDELLKESKPVGP